MRYPVNHDSGPLFRRQTAQVREAMLRHHDLHVVLGMIDMPCSVTTIRTSCSV